jgi:pyruvate dehydrogenase E2 component (dihydrolipoamide acetyltransferase)
MPIQILMPALSPTMEDGTLAKWLVKEGDSVQSGDIIAEIETDKATMEFETVDDGTIGKILVADGSSDIKVNTPIAILLEEGESASDLNLAQSAPTAEPDKPAAAAGASAASAASVPAQPAAQNANRVFATPLARRIARDKGLDLSTISGSGPNGRIVKADVETATPAPAAPAAAVNEATARSGVSEATAPAAAAQSDVAKLYADRDTIDVPLDGMRRTIAARLSEAKQTIPHFYLRRDVCLDALLDLRQSLNAQLAGRGTKLSVNDFIIKACAAALQAVPDANAIWAGDRIIRLVPSDVAVAVAIEGGLFTPVLRDAHIKSLSALSAEMKELAARARDKKLAPQDYQGGSFAISNLGMFGIENFDAVINPPHGAILAVGAGLRKPVVADNGALTSATMMSVTLSVDHRVIDGALGAKLLAAIVDNLENPMLMLA